MCAAAITLIYSIAAPDEIAFIWSAPRAVVIFFIQGQQGSIALISGEFPGQIKR
jgi:hypothetical protein